MLKKVLLILTTILVITGCENTSSPQTFATMFMYIEKKEHYIAPGEYIKMWVVGSNASDDGNSKEKYKIMIIDSRIYNLLEEGKEYFVTIEGTKENKQSDYLYTFGQLGLPEGTQLTGEGIIE